jgi:hypothetical protein
MSAFEYDQKSCSSACDRIGLVLDVEMVEVMTSGRLGFCCRIGVVGVAGEDCSIEVDGNGGM